jgi:hypothetical protein
VRLCRHFGVRVPAATWTGSERRVHVPDAAPALAEAS